MAVCTQPPVYSSSLSSSTRGAVYPERCSGWETTCVSVAVVTADAGAGWPVAALKVPPAFALPLTPVDADFFFLPFFAV